MVLLALLLYILEFLDFNFSLVAGYLTEVFYGFPQALQENMDIKLKEEKDKRQHEGFLPYFLQVFIYNCTI